MVFDGNSRLSLTRIGNPEPGYRATSYPTRIQVHSGPFSVSVEAAAQNFGAFKESLVKLHASMAGKATLAFWNEEHAITLTGDGIGGVRLAAKITDSRSPSQACLTVQMFLDQSYLPTIIAGIGRHFPGNTVLTA
jgi:hypothetical protein